MYTIKSKNHISPYLFVLALELLGETFRKYLGIQGIEIGRNEHRISQFADDTTLFMCFREENLKDNYTFRLLYAENIL